MQINFSDQLFIRQSQHVFHKNLRTTPCSSALVELVSFKSKLASHIHNFGENIVKTFKVKKILKWHKLLSPKPFLFFLNIQHGLKFFQLKTRCLGHSKNVRSLFDRSYFYKMKVVRNFSRWGARPFRISLARAAPQTPRLCSGVA